MHTQTVTDIDYKIKNRFYTLHENCDFMVKQCDEMCFIQIWSLEINQIQKRTKNNNLN